MSTPISFFNPVHDLKNSTFHVFPRLPKELRLQIWRHALLRQRIIKLHLSDPEPLAPGTAADSTATPQYCVILDGFRLLSKLLHVCSESRLAAFEFYRVQIPCYFVHLEKYTGVETLMETATHDGTKDRVRTTGTLYFNPEWDFLNISCNRAEPATTLPPFLHDLKTRYDPHSVGLLNVVLQDNTLPSLDPEAMEPEIRVSVQQTLRQLHEVFFNQTVEIQPLDVRVPWQDFTPWTFTWYNRSFPIPTKIPAFYHVAPDPRAVSQDVKRQYLGDESWRQAIYITFTKLLSAFSVSQQETTTQLTFMISFDPKQWSSEIHGRDDAERWLEDDRKGLWIHSSNWPPKGEDRPVEGIDSVVESEPAFGFWLFPVDTTNITETGGLEGISNLSLLTPELGLAEMPFS